MPSMFYIMLGLIVGGIALFAVGFSLRNRGVGILLTWAGVVLMLSTIVYKVHATLD